MRRWVIGLVLAASGTLAFGALARRVPAPGGEVVVALPLAEVASFVDAQLFPAVLEPMEASSARDRLAHPPLAEHPEWSSSILHKLKANKDETVWTLTPRIPSPAFAEALDDCLNDTGPVDWPALALEAAGVTATIQVGIDNVVLRFSEPVGAVPELLAGCLVRVRGIGPFIQGTTGALVAQKGAITGAPMVSQVVVRERGMSDAGDLVGGSPPTPESGSVLAPFPDVVFLMQSRAAIEQDPFRLDDTDGGERSFRADLRGDLLAAMYWSGRGGPAFGILPPGLAPARPLPEPASTERVLTPLSLDTLDANAPTLTVYREPGQVLVDGVIDRLAVLLRGRGYAVELQPQSVDGLEDGVEVVSWRPDAKDPALALLALAGRYPELRGLPAEMTPLRDPALLSSDLEKRLAAAVAVERYWLETHRVVPLVIADRWLGFQPGLRGIRLRPDGVPLIADAYWEPAP